MTVAEYEIAELKAQVEELSRQIWILTQGDDWLKRVKTQPLSAGTGMDHGGLAGLADDDHSIYLKADGTRGLTGNMAVTATKTIDGRDVSVDGTKLDTIATNADVTGSNAPQAHKDSHDPNDGSDKLDTANAASIAGVQAAGTGTAHSLARSDHAHGIAHSIADNHLVTIDHAAVADNDYAKFTANGLEGRSYQEAINDITAVSGATNEHVLTKDTGTGNAIFKAAAGGGGTSIEDADADTKVDTEEAADEDKVRMDVAGTERFVLQNTAPHLTVTGQQKISGQLGLEGTTPNANYSLYVNKTNPPDGCGVYVAPTGTGLGSYKGMSFSPTSFTLPNLFQLIGVDGAAIANITSGATSNYMKGLTFLILVGGGGGGAVVTEVTGQWLRVGQQGFEGTITNMKGCYIQSPYRLSGTPVVTTYVGLDIQNPTWSAIQNAYVLRLGDCTLATNNYIIEAGPTPYLRLKGSGSWTPAANETPLWLAEGVTPTLRHVQWKAGNALVAGDKVLVLV